MTKQGYTHLSLLIDRSGSMQTIRDDAEGGIASFVADQTASPGEATITLYDFDHDYRQVFGPVAIGEAPSYTLSPRGNTALLDALGRAVTETGEFLAGLAEDQRPATVIFAVVTDGQENASREWTRDQVKDLVDRQTTRYGWQFAFLSADLNAVSDARNLGFAAAASASYRADGAGTRAAYNSLSSSVRRSRATGAPLVVEDTD